MSKVIAVRGSLHGHSQVELEGGKLVTITRGSHVPKVGDQYPPTEELELSPVQEADASKK